MTKQDIVDAFFTNIARIEEQSHANAVILPHFPRSIQLDYHSCGAKSTYTILKYFGKRCTTATVEKQLGTDEDGTSPSNIKRVLRMYELNIRVNTKMSMRDMKEAINAGSPILISLYDGWHYSVVYGYSASHIFVMNPSLDSSSMGSIWNAVPKRKFNRIWDRWGIRVLK